MKETWSLIFKNVLFSEEETPGQSPENLVKIHK